MSYSYVATSLACSFLLLNDIALYGCTNFSLSVHQLMDRLFALFGYYKKMLLRTFLFKTLCPPLSRVDILEWNW